MTRRRQYKRPMTHEERQALIRQPLPSLTILGGHRWAGITLEYPGSSTTYHPRLDELDGDTYNWPNVKEED
jgi:hypothetical protein